VRRRIIVLGVAAVAVVTVAFGLLAGGEEGGAPSREAYLRARVAFDQRADRALVELERATVLRSPGLRIDGGARLGEELRAVLRRLRHALRSGADELAQAEPPDDVRRAHRLLIDSAGGVARLAGRLARRPRLTGLQVESAFFRSHDMGALGRLVRAGDELDAKGYLPDAPTGSRPPRSPEVRGCRLRAEGRPLTPDREEDTIIGPVTFTGFPAIHRGYASRPGTWRDSGMTGVRSIALVRAGAQVTLVVPSEQRRWMRLLFWPGFRRRVEPLALEACRSLKSRRAQRRECGWGGRPPWNPSNWACRLRYTQFSGGFGLDFENAPKRGLCAELIVRAKGERMPLREFLFDPEPGTCEGGAG
jgi:hypothetical protein